jgi:selenoprotein W-related protein
MLVESSGGVFEIEVDGKTVYSKRKTGEFPDESLLLEKIKDLLIDGDGKV